MEKFSADPPPQETNAAMEHGHKFENEARCTYEEEYDILMPPKVIIRGCYMASLDGWNQKKEIVLEIKSPYTHVYSETWQRAVDGKLPDHYYAQVQHQLMVSGSKLCHFYVYNSRKRRGLMVKVKPNTAYFAVIIKAWELFYAKYA
jgi:putative phage-type endonuclease